MTGAVFSPDTDSLLRDCLLDACINRRGHVTEQGPDQFLARGQHEIRAVHFEKLFHFGVMATESPGP